MAQQRNVFWCGPVALFQVPQATVPSARRFNLDCKGDRHPSCGQIADGWLADGRRMPAFLRAVGLMEPGELFLGAFSAGGSMLKRLCIVPEDRAPVRAIMLSDATYSSPYGGPLGAPDEGFIQFGLEAATGSKFFWASASANGAGNITLGRLRQAIEQRAGKAFEPVVDLPLPVQPDAAWRLGNVTFADYGSRLTHGQHAGVLAGPAWQNMLVPWLEGVGPPTSSSGHSGQSAAAKMLAALVGVGVGYAATRAAVREWR